MRINAGELGILDVNEDDIIVFEKGLIGLRELKKFILLKGDDQGVFKWLQSIDDPNKRFALMDVSRFISDYKPIGADSALNGIGNYESEEQLDIYNVTVIPQNFLDMTVNLKAPIIINKNCRKGLQYVSDNEKYLVKYYIQREMQKLGAGE